MGVVSVGIDAVAPSDVERSVVRFGARYLDRVYTRTEQAAAMSGTAPGVGCRRLAARFAAKEAVFKALRPSDPPMPWTAIEIVSDGSAAARPVLHGVAATAAEQAGIDSWSLSWTHAGDLAVAVAIGSTNEVPPEAGPRINEVPPEAGPHRRGSG